jgi:hypothetical protein
MARNTAGCESIISAATAKFPDLRWSGGHGLESISIHVAGRVDGKRRHEVESWLHEFEEDQRLAAKVYLIYDDETTSREGH